jgi:precorrin-6B methylase 2
MQQRLVANYVEIHHMYKDSRFFQFLGSDIVRMQTSNSMLA